MEREFREYEKNTSKTFSSSFEQFSFRMITRVSLAMHSECRMARFFYSSCAPPVRAACHPISELEAPWTPAEDSSVRAEGLITILREEQGCPLTSAAASSPLTPAGGEGHTSCWVFQVANPCLCTETRCAAL